MSQLSLRLDIELGGLKKLILQMKINFVIFPLSALPMKPSSANSSATDIAMLLKQQQEQQQPPQQPNLGKPFFPF